MKFSELYEHSLENREPAIKYLASRGVSNDKVGYVEFVMLKRGPISNSVIIPSFNVIGELVSMDIRSIEEKHFSKISSTKMLTNIYNIENAIENLDYVVITESAIDTMSLLGEGINSVSTLSASAKTASLHLLSCFNKIILAFDNDSSGVENSRRVMEFYKKYYDKDIELLDFYAKDINEALMENKSEFKDIIRQIKSIVS